MIETCKDCKFFARNALNPKGDGQCRYDAPRMFVFPAQNGQLLELGGWPPVGPDKWCRQFARKSLDADKH